MKLFICMLERRGAFVHITLSMSYLVTLLIFNSEAGGITAMRALALLLTGVAGIGVAYTARYVLVLNIRRRQAVRAAILLLTNFSLFGISGYLLFHGLENPISAGVVGPSVGHPWQDYIRFYLGWYFNFAKYGMIFFAFEKYLFDSIDWLLSRYRPDDMIALVGFYSHHPYWKETIERNPLVIHFSSNLISRVCSWLLSNTRISSERLNHLVNLLDYGTQNFVGPPRHTVPLEDEITAARHFLSMEGDHDIDVKVSGDVRGVQIPPVLLVSITKNMVKHGNHLPGEPHALLDIRIEDSTLRIYSENGIAAVPRWKRTDSGHGLRHIQQRLKEVYGNRAVLRTGINGDRFWLEIQIDNLKRYNHE